MVLTSCVTKQPETNNQLPYAPVVVTEKDVTSGSVVYQKAVKPDSKLLPEVKELKIDHIPEGSDISVEDLMKTTLIWGTQYNDLKHDYTLLKGWVLGVYAAQNSIIDAKSIENQPKDEKVVDKPVLAINEQDK